MNGAFLVRVFRYWLSGLAIAMAGCSSRLVINAGTGQVNLKVWRVLAPGDFVGSQGNWGCRLSDSEITAIVTRLQQDGWVFGGNTQFVWNGQIAIITNGYEQPQFGFPRGSPSTLLDLWIDDNTATSWRNLEVNIYFSGNYTVGGAGVWGATWDPAAHSPAVPRYRSILVNDGGLTDGFGHRQPVLLQGRVTPHEMCHYLARFSGRTFSIPGTPRMYTSGEHTGNANTNNLLRDGGLTVSGLPPYPPVIPGLSAVLGTEKQEIYQRVIDGLWNSP